MYIICIIPPTIIIIGVVQVNIVTVNNTIEYLKQYGWLEGDINTAETYTNEFAIKAAEELGLEDPDKK